MSLPFHLSVGPLTLHSHLLFEILAFFLGFRYFLWLRRRTVDQIETPNRIVILIAAALGALLGSRLLGGLEEPDLFFSGGGPAGWLFYTQHKTIVGGLLGGLMAVEGTKQYLGVRSSSGDLFTFPLIAGIAIGRIGCFLSGIEDQTYGIVSQLPWAMDLGDGIPRHPTALYEILFLLGLGLTIWLVERKTALANGRRFQLFMTGYLLFRLGIDFLKPGDALPVVAITSIQLACVLGLVYYGQLFWRTRPSLS